GKSTFLKVLAGLIPPDSGEVSYRKGTKVVYLSQDPEFEAGKSIWEAIFDAPSAALEAIQQYEKLLEKGQTASEEFQKALETMERLRAWDIEARIKETLGKLGIADTTQEVSSLSGGQRKRVALARVILSEPDLLLLDEPTNHLDIETIEWLEQFLGTQNTSLLLITHDRYFLDRVTNRIVELDHGEVFRYEGNYQYFLEQKAERRRQQGAVAEKAQNLLRKELDWLRRMPKARGTKAKYRVEGVGELQKQAKLRPKDDNVQIEFEGQRLGGKILELKNLYFEYESDTPILDRFTYTFRRGERVGIVGKNGAGKTTFLKLLMGELEPKLGKVVKGQNTVFGYYSQLYYEFDPEMRVIEVVKEIAEFIPLPKGRTLSASQLLEQFLFPPKRQYEYVAKLSGGERRRLQLLRILMKNPNFLILDEPTNDLDLQTLGVLEDFLEQFGGCLMIVSHDRYFMDQLVEHLFVFEGEGKIRDFPGNYSDYKSEVLDVSSTENKKVEKEPSEKVEKVKETKTKLSFKEKREFEALENEIADLEERKAEITQQMSSTEADFEQLQAWGEELEQLTETLEEKEMRWLELSEYV
ncbi:MAG: ABC-F family ATP-binding cassette domain-containing protein, partial [Bacteroidota bacterium]